MNILDRGNSSVVLRPTPLGTIVPKTPLVRTTIMEAELPPSLPSEHSQQNVVQTQQSQLQAVRLVAVCVQ